MVIVSVIRIDETFILPFVIIRYINIEKAANRYLSVNTMYAVIPDKYRFLVNIGIAPQDIEAKITRDIPFILGAIILLYVWYASTFLVKKKIKLNLNRAN